MGVVVCDAGHVGAWRQIEGKIDGAGGVRPAKYCFAGHIHDGYRAVADLCGQRNGEAAGGWVGVDSDLLLWRGGFDAGSRIVERERGGPAEGWLGPSGIR